jgi:hypothetical protein
VKYCKPDYVHQVIDDAPQPKSASTSSGVDTCGKSDLKGVLGLFFYFPRYRPPFGECCVCSLSLFRFEIRVVCVCGNLCTCVHVSTNLESPPTMGNFKV